MVIKSASERNALGLNGLINWLYFKLLNAIPDTNTHPGTDAGANYY